MSEVLGVWSNAPLVYVLAEVRTEFIADLPEYQPKIAGYLRDEFPIQRPMRSARIVAAGSRLALEEERDAAWEFASPDNKAAIVIRPSGFVYHATKYQDSADFLKRLGRIVDYLGSQVQSAYVNRLGLRYVDFVLPRKNEDPDLYVNPRLSCDLGLGKSPAPMCTSIGVYTMKGGQVALRYIRMHGPPKLPPDLQTTSLAPSHLMGPRRFESPLSGVIDTDSSHVFNPVQKLEPDEINRQFSMMRHDIRSSFDTAISDHARSVWGAK